MAFEKIIEQYSPAYRAKLEEVLGLIKVELDNCQPGSTPAICQISSSDKGYEEVAAKIVWKIYHWGMSVGEAITQVEIELNPMRNDLN